MLAILLGALLVLAIIVGVVFLLFRAGPSTTVTSRIFS